MTLFEKMSHEEPAERPTASTALSEIRRLKKYASADLLYRKDIPEPPVDPEQVKEFLKEFYANKNRAMANNPV